jgi:hypothetical protein
MKATNGLYLGKIPREKQGEDKDLRSIMWGCTLLGVGTNTVAVQKRHPQVTTLPADLFLDPAVCVGMIACI